MTDKPAKISTGGVKKGRNQGQKIVTANRLTDGVVVYRDPEGAWIEDIEKALIVEGDDAMSLLSASTEDEKLVVGPYLMDVETEADQLVPTGRGLLRETIRNLGPTIHPEYGRQAEEATSGE